MNLTSRLRAVEQAVNRLLPATVAGSIFDRIDELTALFMVHPAAFSPEVEAGILAAVEREERAEGQVYPTGTC